MDQLILCIQRLEVKLGIIYKLHNQIIIAHATEHESPILKACFTVNPEGQLQTRNLSGRVII